MSPRVLFIVHADYDALERKGVAAQILDRDEDGFFERVVTVHPLAARTRSIALNPTHLVQEYGFAPGIWGEGLSWRELLAMPVRALQVALMASRLGRKERVDLVRSTDPYFCGLVGWLVARRLRVPLCVSLHADYSAQFALTPRRAAARLARRLAGYVRRFVFRRAALVLPIRTYLARAVSAEGVDTNRVRVIPHGVDLPPPLDRATARAGFGLQEPLVVFVGRLAPGNYVEDVLEAAAVARVRHPRVTVLMVGSGEEEAKIRGRAETDSRLRGAVHFTGFVPRAVARAAFAAADVVVCPMGGFSLIEACAAGAAVVTYDLEWHTELVEHGVTGLVAPAGDVAALAAGIEYLLDSPGARRALGEAAQARVRMRHDIARTSAIKRDVYRELLSMKRAG